MGDGTCALIVHVARRLPRARLLLLAAYREAEAEANPALIRALGELGRLRVLQRVPLRRLRPEETADLVSGLLGAPASPAATALLHRHGEGNPFFEEELLRALLEEGALVPHAGRWDVALEPDRLLPQEILEAIRLRLARLAPEVIEVLGVAAVVGRTFEPGLLASVVGADEERVDAHLGAATRAHLTRPQAEGGYAFTHDKVRDALLIDLGQARRRRLHREVGLVLEERGAPAAAKVFHFVEGGDRERGASYGLTAAEDAMRSSAAADAVRHYRTALSLLPTVPAPVLVRLGDAAMAAGDHDQAASAYRRAGEAFVDRGERVPAATAWRLLGTARWRQEAIDEARTAFERGLELAGGDRGESAAILVQLAELQASSLSDPVAGLACAERARAMAAEAGERRLEMAACRTAGNVQARCGDLDAGRALLERALSPAAAEDDPIEAAETCASLFHVYLWLGEVGRAEDVQSRRERLALRTQDTFQLRHVYTWLAGLRSFRGDWEQAEVHFSRAEAIVGRLESPEPLAFLHAIRAGDRLRRGLFSGAAFDYEAAIGILRQHTGAAVVWYLPSLGIALAELGRPHEGVARAAEAERIVEELEEGSVICRFALAGLTQLYVQLGDAERAAACYQRMRPGQARFYSFLVDRALGVGAACAGDLDAARRALGDAEHLARREGLRPELALTLLQRGLVERGAAPRNATQRDSTRALAEGLRLCDELGMGEVGRRMIERGPIPRRRRRHRRTSPDALTERERELVRLLGEGRSNRDIAAALALSEKTVANALTIIFAKLGVENRVAAVAHMLRESRE